MRRSVKRTVVGAIAATMALTSLAVEPVRAASSTSKAPVAAPANVDLRPTDVSTQRRRYYRHGGGNPAAALAFAGVVAGTIGAIAASRRHRNHYGAYYPYGGYGPAYPVYGPRYGYGYGGGYGYGYGGGPYGYRGW